MVSPAQASCADKCPRSRTSPSVAQPAMDTVGSTEHCAYANCNRTGGRTRVDSSSIGSTKPCPSTTFHEEGNCLLRSASPSCWPTSTVEPALAPSHLPVDHTRTRFVAAGERSSVQHRPTRA
jgi:hypothetical protein